MFLRTFRIFPMPLSLPTAIIQSMSNTHIKRVSRLLIVHGRLPTDVITALNGYSAKLTGAALEAVLSDPNVDFLTEDSVTYINRAPNHSQTNDTADSVPAKRDNFPNIYGEGVDIYIIGEIHPYSVLLYR
jgi:hypothetical protein